MNVIYLGYQESGEPRRKGKNMKGFRYHGIPLPTGQTVAEHFAYVRMLAAV
jgi:hypothetical protein